MFWAGLRGAVAVAMALSLPADIPQRGSLQEITFGVVLFTLLVQGTTVGQVIDRTIHREAIEPERPRTADTPT
jgi:CPA1 family monovalent cation:H+ antiporter